MTTGVVSGRRNPSQATGRTLFRSNIETHAGRTVITTLTSKQLVARALAGLDVPRPAVGPLAVHYCAKLAGVTIREYTTDPVVLADCVVRYYETFRPDAVWLSADTWVTAQAMGTPVAFPEGDQPMGGTGEPLVRSAADIDRIPPPDPTSQGRWPMMLDAARRIRERIGEDVYLVACFDQYPFSLACAAMGVDRLMLALMDDRPLVTALLKRCCEYAAAYARALGDAGADMLSGGDSPAGLIGPELYREIALPWEKRVVEQIKQTCDQPVSLHICGDATPILRDMATSGADVLELDHKVDLATVFQAVGPDVAIWGNLDPVGVLAQGSPENVRRATREVIQTAENRGHRRLVVSSGCTLAVETPEENIRAMMEATQT